MVATPAQEPNGPPQAESQLRADKGMPTGVAVEEEAPPLHVLVADCGRVGQQNTDPPHRDDSTADDCQAGDIIGIASAVPDQQHGDDDGATGE